MAAQRRAAKGGLFFLMILSPFDFLEFQTLAVEEHAISRGMLAHIEHPGKKI
jgi:hypothetical protein